MILVTGATGFIGSHLVERLVEQGTRVRCLVRASSSLQALPREAVEIVRGDLATGAGLAEAMRGINTVIHLAGVTKAVYLKDYYSGNLDATANLLGAAAGVRRFVHVSSLAAAGPSEDAPLAEEVPPHPVSHYGRSKLAGEEAVRQSLLCARAVVVRPPVVYGPRDRDVFQMIHTISRGWLVRIGAAERRFSCIYVADLVTGLLAAADQPAASGRIFYLAHPSSVSWEEFATLTAGLMGRTVRFATVPESVAYGLGWCAEQWSRLSGKPGILSRDKVTEACARGWVCDTSRARDELGFRAATSLEAGLRQSLEWYREAGWLKN
jgi:nucleoside-diphosphate-sugar epimerase